MPPNSLSAGAYQWWLSYDAHFIEALCGKPEQLDADMIAEIGRPYGVSRTLGMAGYSDLADVLQPPRMSSELGLTERANRICELLDNWQPKKPFSAASKVSWFVWPENWTMFDTFASKAVGVSGTDTASRFENFYQKIEDRGFTQIVGNVRKCLPPWASKLLAERTVDFFLLLTGDDKKERRFPAIENFTAALPPDLKNSVRGAGASIAEILENSDLLKSKAR